MGFLLYKGRTKKPKNLIIITLDLISSNAIIFPSKPGPLNLGANDPIVGDSLNDSLINSIFFLVS